MIITNHYTIKGSVQQVGYRDYIKKHADAVGLKGVANHGDDKQTVIVVAQGDALLFDQFERALRFGSVLSFVRSLDTRKLDKCAYYRSFQVEGIVLSAELTEALEKVKNETHQL